VLYDCQARRVLEWSYCLAYYLKEGGKKTLFEYQQQMLVGNTEALQYVRSLRLLFAPATRP
jgi:hypothetical protein